MKNTLYMSLKEIRLNMWKISRDSGLTWLLTIMCDYLAKKLNK